MAPTPRKAVNSADGEVELTGAKLKRIAIRNFGCIGPNPVSVDLDDIVVLVGPNNVGKSTILRAYEVVMNHGKLSPQDFPGEECDAAGLDEERCPEVVLETYVADDCRVGAEWLIEDPEGGRRFVRERWRWTKPNADPDRQGYSTAEGGWAERVPWGAPNVAKSHRPIPHRVDAFAHPDEQAKQVLGLLQKALKDRIKALTVAECPQAGAVLKGLQDLQKEIVSEVRERIGEVERRLSENVAEVFSGYAVEFDPGLDEAPEFTKALFTADARLRMGPTGGHLSPIAQQGSGARRTLLWAAIRLLAETDSQAPSGRGHVLLMDEPEICLHPNAIREACKALYDLAQTATTNWQVIITTHSPAFIDLSRDNTTIVRVERAADDVVRGTTVFRPDRARLDADDRKELKLLNACDPYVAEFFFGGRTVLVEGDTEYAVFHRLALDDPDTFAGLHVVRARGKAAMVALMKILNHFGAPYSALHDADTPETERGVKNPAWTVNASLQEQARSAPEPNRVRLVASIWNFEQAFLKRETKVDKPYAAVSALGSETDTYRRVKELLVALVDHKEGLPEGAMQWSSTEELGEAIKAARAVMRVMVV